MKRCHLSQGSRSKGVAQAGTSRRTAGSTKGQRPQHSSLGLGGADAQAGVQGPKPLCLTCGLPLGQH